MMLLALLIGWLVLGLLALRVVVDVLYGIYVGIYWLRHGERPLQKIERDQKAADDAFRAQHAELVARNREFWKPKPKPEPEYQPEPQWLGFDLRDRARILREQQRRYLAEIQHLRDTHNLN